MSKSKTCQCGYVFESKATDEGKSVRCSKCGRRIDADQGKRQRMYLFERAYKDYTGYLFLFWYKLSAVSRGIWNWLWKGVGAGIVEKIILIGTVLAGISFAVGYLVFEVKNGGTLDISALIGAIIIGGFVGISAFGWKAPIHWLACLTSALSAAGSILVVGLSMLIPAIILFVSYLLGLFVLTVISFLVFVPIRISQEVKLLLRRITYSCPWDDCPTNGRDLPIHICECGREYHDLKPSFYGIFYHKCRHTDGYTKLPTLDCLGRNKLKRKCSGCNHDLLHSSLGDARPFTFAVVGAKDSGKTMLITQAVRTLCGSFSEDSDYAVRIDSKDQAADLQEPYFNLDHGQPLDKTTAAVMQSIGVLFQHRRDKKKKTLLQIFDAPGEHFQTISAIGRKQNLQRTQGLVLLLDPERIPKLAKHIHGTKSPTHDEETQQTVVDNFIQFYRSAAHDMNQKIDIPLVVVLTKMDIFSAKIQKQIYTAPTESWPANHLEHHSAKCKKLLEICGCEHILRSLEQTFSHVRYCACSAMGRIYKVSDKTPFEAKGVVEPFIHLLSYLDTYSFTAFGETENSVSETFVTKIRRVS